MVGSRQNFVRLGDSYRIKSQSLFSSVAIEAIACDQSRQSIINGVCLINCAGSCDPSVANSGKSSDMQRAQRKTVIGRAGQ